MAYRDIYQEITTQVLALMESHGANWTKPWVGSAGESVNLVSKKAYRGINVFLLGLDASRKGFGSPIWATFKQWRAAGGSVVKGEHGTGIVFYKRVVKAPDTPDESTYMLLRGYTVFNHAQTQGVDIPAPELPELPERISGADNYIANLGSDIRGSQGRAYYVPASDYICLPDISQFTGTDTSTAQESYYATSFHEHGHWTGHKSRCDRHLSGYFGSPDYAFEELIAELSSAFLCQRLGITSSPRDDHAKYLNNWIKGMRENKGAIVRASTQASKALDYMDSLQGDTATDSIAA